MRNSRDTLCHFVIGLLVFGGLGRIAFWRNEDGLRVGGMLAVGLALLLTIAIIIWADENGRRISEWGLVHSRYCHHGNTHPRLPGLHQVPRTIDTTRQ